MKKIFICLAVLFSAAFYPTLCRADSATLATTDQGIILLPRIVIWRK